MRELSHLDDRDFLSKLQECGVQIRASEGRLRVNAPVGMLNSTLQDELLRRKVRLLSILSANSHSHDKIFPLTYAQERVWLIEQFHPNTPAYNIPEAFVVEGFVDPATLQETVRQLTLRHDILRAHFLSTGSEVAQHVIAAVEIPVGFTDLSTIEEQERHSQLLVDIRREARRPFDLTQAPLMRCHLFRLANSKHVIFLNVHHIIADRWSMGILQRELTLLYANLSTKGSTVLPPLHSQYTDYASKERVDGQTNIHQQLAYWKTKLSNPPSPLELPFSKRRPLAQSFEGAIEPFDIRLDLGQKLRLLARQEKASLYMLLLAAFSLLLYRYTSKRDLCIGSPISARNNAETESLIGLFVNTVVMRCLLDPSWSFRQLLQHIRDTVLEAHANSNVPFQKLVMELHPERDPATSPLFQVMFALDSFTPRDDNGLPKIDTQPGVSKFDLTLQLSEAGGAVTGGLEYRMDLFDPSSIRQFAENLSVLLHSIAFDPDATIARLPILSNDQQKRILIDWNATKFDFQRETLMHQLFEQCAIKSPNATAIIFGTEHINYAALNEKANHLAHHLIACGVKSEICVGICLHRSISMITAMLAVLKAGGAYVPLDPSYPVARLSFIAEDSGLHLVISETQVLERISFSVPQIVNLEKESDHISIQPSSNPEVIQQPENLAYIIYTSGSTGEPKGVAIEHHSTLSLLQWGRMTFPEEALQYVLASTSICFDLSIFEIFLPLSLGHTIVLAENVMALPDLPASNQVTLINTVPSAIAALIQAHAIPASAKCILLAGESLPTSLVDKIDAAAPSVQVFDLYGPTETTTYSTCARRYPGEPATIGHPIANTQIYILDENLQPIPPGIPGQLFIGGNGVARGYLHRPALTAERFRKLPHLPSKGCVYQTGDLARYRDDGNIEYFGRIDQQVKIRGFRIEPGEIESVLRRHPYITDAAVIQLHDDALGNTLAACIVIPLTASIDLEDIVDFQRIHLPSYMVVNQIKIVEQFPLTPNGKIDRKTIALLCQQSVITVYTAPAPSNVVEQELVQIWEQCFERKPIGIDEDFFALGGHSLLALRIFGEIEKRLGKMMMLSLLFQAPTVRKLAEFIHPDA